jgi:hypothetical protein
MEEREDGGREEGGLPPSLIFFSRQGSLYVAQAGLELAIFLP